MMMARRLAVLLLLMPASATAQQAVGASAFHSGDADGTRVDKVSVMFDWTHRSDEEYLGIELERALFAPLSQPAQAQQRVYLRNAGSAGDWKYHARIGSNGDTLLGSASIHRGEEHRHEYFLERDVIETPLGLRNKLHHTFVAGAWDIPTSERGSLMVLAGLQDFSGDNLRTHARARYSHLLDETHGISAQLRVKAFRNSHPHEYDYYSPQWYAEAIPMLQLRRFRGGWMYRVAGGYGVQRDNDRPLHGAGHVEATVTSPKRGAWRLRGDAIHSDTPIGMGPNYRYTMVMLQLQRQL